MTVEQKLKTLPSDCDIRIFNRLTGTNYYYGSLHDYKSYSNIENYNSLRNCIVITCIKSNIYDYDKYFIGVDVP